MLYIKNSRLVAGPAIAGDVAVLIDGGTITAVGPAAMIKAPPQAKIVDGRGLIAAPGLIDWQINGGFGEDFTENPASIWSVGGRLVEHGVTAFLPTIVTSPLETVAAAQAAWGAGAPAGYRGAKPLGLHLEGPYLNPGKKGAHRKEWMRAPSEAETEAWSRRRGVWLVTLAPELPGAGELIRRLGEKGVVVSAGHSLATYDEALEGFVSGVSGATHLFNAMPPMEHRAPGLVAAALLDPGTTIGMIPDGVHVDPRMIKLAWMLKTRRRFTIVTDAMKALGLPPGIYAANGRTVTVDGASARLEDGTLAGSVVSLNAAVRNLMDFTGCSLAEAIGAASTHVARFIRLSRKGRIRPGADADLVLLNEQAEVFATVVAGEVAYSRL